MRIFRLGRRRAPSVSTRYCRNCRKAAKSKRTLHAPLVKTTGPHTFQTGAARLITNSILRNAEASPMKTRDKKSAAAADEKATFTFMSRDTISRREFLAVSAAVGVTMLLPGGLSAAVHGKKTFTILHTNDMHSSFIGMGPSSDYTPFSLNDDSTRGGYARLATLIAERREARKGQGPVLVLDAGDYSMGTAFAAASRETGGELELMTHMGYDATTFGNHEFDLGPDGLGRSIGVAAKAGRIPAVVASNTDFAKQDATLGDLQRLAKDGAIRRYVVIERGGIRFGIFGVLGKETQIYTGGAGAVTFSDAIETAKEMVKVLRETEKVDVVIALSHGGVRKGQDGRFSEGDDVRVADVPGVDIVIGGHSHTELQEAIMVNGRAPLVQTGLESRNLGELVMSLDGGKIAVQSYGLYPINDSIAGEIDKLKKLPPPGTVDQGSVATGAGKDGVREIKEWQAIMDHLHSLPVKNPGELPVIPVDERAAEVRAIKAS
ncbi:MAG: hypothetical protein COT06_07590 [Syntrophobacteraceae bacterium CG07_land_8_20_14_0_80_61_8]|nr:MAG: hypothetical protein COT06_07590 [Syntrophobacteraceae bacterium CG07_land_8_20_14_0_80_61_8]